MHLLHALVAASDTTTTVAKKSSSSSSPWSFVIILALFAGVYFLFLRPRTQRMRQQQRAVSQLEVGDEVQTAGGILGIIVAIDGDEIEVQVAPDVVMTFVRRSVGRRPDAASVPAAAQGPVDDDTDDAWASRPAVEESSGPVATPSPEEPPGPGGPGGEIPPGDEGKP